MSELKTLQLTSLKSSAINPRLNFDEEKLKELSLSIKEKGLIEPIVVRPSNGKYEIICGERRFRASKLAGLKEIPAIVKTLTDIQALETQIIENLQRDDLEALEEATGYKSLIDKCKYTQEQLAKKIGKSQGYIAARLSLLEIRDDFKKDMRSGKLLPGHIKYITTLTGCNRVLDGIRKEVDFHKEVITVREFDSLVDGVISRRTKPLQKDNYGGGPLFDISVCKDCKFKRTYKSSWSSGEQIRCYNSPCYNKKQAEARSKVSAQAKKLAADGKVVDSAQVGKTAMPLYGYQCKFDIKTCEKCPKKSVVLTMESYGSMKKIKKPVCLDKACFEKQTKQHEEAEEKRRFEAFKADVLKAKKKAATITIDNSFWASVIFNEIRYDGHDAQALNIAFNIPLDSLKNAKTLNDYFTRNKHVKAEEVFKFTKLADIRY